MIPRQTTFLITLFWAFLFIKCQRPIDQSNFMFADNILKELISRHRQENFVVSPYFIQRMLTLAMFGAKEQLRDEIQSVTGLEPIEEDECFSYFKKYPSSLLINNRMFYNSSLQLRKVFRITAEKYFETIPQAFTEDDPAKIAQFINKIVEQSSRRFKNFLDPSYLHTPMAGLLLNTVYFKDQWLEAFDRDSKRIGKFYDYGQKAVNTLALYGVRNMGYAELPELNATAIQLPFKNSAMKLLILEPNQGAQDLNWSEFEISEILEDIEMESVAVSLPVFNVESHIDLSTTLMNLGLKSFFSPKANYLNAFYQLSEDAEVEFLHAAQMELNEYGSNVKVGTLEAGNGAPNKNSPRKFFIVERPFVFVLHSNEAVYMAGRIAVLNGHKSANIKIKDNLIPKHIITFKDTEEDEND